MAPESSTGGDKGRARQDCGLPPNPFDRVRLYRSVLDLSIKDRGPLVFRRIAGSEGVHRDNTAADSDGLGEAESGVRSPRPRHLLPMNVVGSSREFVCLSD